MKKIFYMVVCCLLNYVGSFAQNSMTDSLLTLLGSSKEDTAKVDLLNSLFLEYEFIDDIKAEEFLNKALELSQKIDYKKGLSTTYVYFGYFAEDKSNYDEALKYYLAGLKIREAIRLPNGQIGDKQGIADSYSNIGNIYYYQGNYPEALKNYFSSLQMREALGNKKGIGDSYITIGNVYYNQGNYTEALKNYFSSLKIKEEIGDKKGVASSYNNIGIVYKEQGNYEEALKNQFASLEIMQMVGDKKNIADSYNNIGVIYFAQAGLEKDPDRYSRKLEEALKSYYSSLEIEEAMGDKAGIASTCINIGNVFVKKKDYKKGGEYFMRAKELSVDIGYKEFLKATYRALTELDSAKGDYKGAYENHKLFVLYRDSLDNEETRKKTIQSQMTFDFEKKEAIANAEHKIELENQQIFAEEKSRKQKIVIVFVVFGLLMVITFAGFIFRSLNVTRKQKNIIEHQKNLVEMQKMEVEQQKMIVEEHQKEIIDSITYARRIQRSLLPTEKYIEKQMFRLKKNISDS